MVKLSIHKGLKFQDPILEEAYQKRITNYDLFNFSISSVQSLLILFFLWIISYESGQSPFLWWPLIFIGLIFFFLLRTISFWSIIINLFSLIAIIEYLFAEDELTMAKIFFLGWAVSHLTLEVFYSVRNVMLKSFLMFLTNIYCFVRIGVHLDHYLMLLVLFNVCKIIHNFKEELNRRTKFQESFVQLKNLEYYKDVLDKGIHSGVAIISLKQDKSLSLIKNEKDSNKTIKCDSKNIFDKPYVNYPAKRLFRIIDDYELFDILESIPVNNDPLPKTKSNQGSFINDQESLLNQIIIELEKVNTKNEEIAFSSKSWADTLMKELIGISIKINDDEISFDITVSKFLRNETTSMILIFNDISDKVMKERLAVLNMHKDHLLATVSHELKTPLNAIFGYTSELMSRDFPSDIMEYFTQIKINSKLLQYQIDNILDFSQLTEDKLIMNYVKFNLATIITHVRSLIISTISQKGLSFSLNIDPTCPKTITSDPHRLKQLLMILVGNALKFTFEGFIEMSIDRIDNNSIRFYIKDSGIGIKEERKKNLFCLFHQEEDINRKELNQHGIGLGLTLSKHLVDKLGPPQQIMLNSEFGKGTEISFVIYVDNQKKDQNEIKHFTRFGTTKKSVIVQNKLELTPIFSHRLLEKPQSFVKKSSENITDSDPRKIARITSSIKEVDEISEEELMKQIPRDSKINISRISLKELNGKNFSSKNKFEETVMDSAPPLKKSNSFSSFDSEFYDENLKKTEDPLVDHQNISSYNFLIVDDTPLNLLILETFILAENKKNSIIKAYNGKQAVEAMLNYPKYFDLVFMDCNMPLMNGYEATTKLKELMKTQKLEECPILAISAYSKVSEDTKWREAGMDEFIQKPLTKNQFQEIYKLWVNKKRMNKGTI